jgi:uncharacterized protein YhaN
MDGGPEQTAIELFGDLPATQYQQLYTVSLDELSRDPESLDDGVDLSSVLFTAAYGNTDIPEIRDDLASRAESIGGVNGSDSYELGDPVETIQAGIEDRDEALEQVGEYEEKSQQKDEVEERIDKIQERLDELDDEQTRIEAIDENYETYHELQTVETKIKEVDADLDDVESFPVDRMERARTLEDQYNEAREELNDARQDFQSRVNVEDTSTYREQLLAHHDSLEAFETELSRWREQVGNLRETAENLRDRRNELEQRVSELHPDWEELDAVRNQTVDTFAEGEIRSVTDEVKTTRSEIDELEDEVQQFESRYDDLESRIEAASEKTGGVPIKSQLPTAAAGIAAAVVFGGGVAISASALGGVVVTIVVLVATGAYLFSNLEKGTPADDGIAIDTLRASREDVESQLESARNALETKRAELEEAESKLSAVKDEYGIPEDADPETVRQFYDTLVDLHSDIANYDTEHSQYHDEESDVESTLGEIRQVLVEFVAVDTNDEASLGNADHLFAATERVLEHHEQAGDVEKAAEAVTGVEEDIVDILDEWEKADNPEPDDVDTSAVLDRFLTHGERVEAARERLSKQDQLRRELQNSLGRQSVAAAFESYRTDKNDDDDEWVLTAFEAVIDEYGGIEAVRGRREEIEDDVGSLDEELERKRDERANLNQELESLASDDEIRAAHETIEKGQRELEPLLEQYATNRIGEYLLDGLHERFIDRTTGPLLEAASDIFERITGNEYTTLNSHNEFDNLDFEAIMADGTEQRTDELSRATAEQLFLAVRLARIKRHEEPLPVLLDDSLTNFDPGHIDRTLDVVSELADETQVFVLTCHPSLLDQVESDHDAAYWCLDDGQFTGPHETADPAYSVLNRS